MPSSHRVVKLGQSVESADNRRIETAFSTEWREPLDQIEQTPSMTEYLALQEQKQKEMIIVERQKMLVEARSEIEKMQQEAWQTGYAKGQTAGFEQGKTEGFQKGYQVGEQEAKTLADKSLGMLAVAPEIVQNYYSEKKLEMLSLATQMAESIVQETINSTGQGPVELLEKALNKIKKEDNFIAISTTKLASVPLKSYLEELRKTTPGFRYAVFIDDNLDQNGCIIETDTEVIDIQIKTQLSMIFETLKNLE